MTKPINKYGLLLGVALCALSSPTYAADLGGTCCADLEERIAELEATTARKGNRKVTLKVYGEVNKGLMFWDADASGREYGEIDGDYYYDESGSLGSSSNQRVIDNGSRGSFVGFSGGARINNDVSAGYVLEIGVGGYDDGGALAGSTNDIYVQRSAFYLKSESLGGLTVGLTSQATDDMDLLTTANTTVAVRPLSLRPITGPQTTEALDLFDGNRANVIRYDSPVMAGFVVSASWASADEDGDDAYDIALRYAGEFQGFKLIAGAGYRQGVVVNDGGSSTVIWDEALDLETWTLTGSIMHMTSGLFLTANYGSGDGSLGDGPTGHFLFNNSGVDTEGFALTGGIERKWFDIGRTTLFGEWGKVEASASVSSTDVPPCYGPGSCFERAEITVDYFGGGIVQSIDAAAMDLYLTVRKYDGDLSEATGGCDVLEDGDVCGSWGGSLNVDATVGMVGARIKF